MRRALPPVRQSAILPSAVVDGLHRGARHLHALAAGLGQPHGVDQADDLHTRPPSWPHPRRLAGPSDRSDSSRAGRTAGTFAAAAWAGLLS